MAKVKRKNLKKYSFNERSDYHGLRVKKFVDKFTVKTEYGSKTDWDKFAIAEKNNSSLSYSDGYHSGSYDALRNYAREDFSRESSAYKKGYEKAQNDFKKALSRKF